MVDVLQPCFRNWHKDTVYIAYAKDMYPFLGMEMPKKIGPAPSPFTYHTQMELVTRKDVDGELIESLGFRTYQLQNPEYSNWNASLDYKSIRLKNTGITSKSIENNRRRRIKGFEISTRIHYAKVIQRHWREARLNPYTKIGRDRLNREYDALMLALQEGPDEKID